MNVHIASKSWQTLCFHSCILQHSVAKLAASANCDLTICETSDTTRINMMPGQSTVAVMQTPQPARTFLVVEEHGTEVFASVATATSLFSVHGAATPQPIPVIHNAIILFQFVYFDIHTGPVRHNMQSAFLCCSFSVFQMRTVAGWTSIRDVHHIFMLIYVRETIILANMNLPSVNMLANENHS